jgi:hypothetical protein
MAEYVHHTGNLAQSCYHTIGYICHMYASVERKHMMFAERIEVDVLYNNHLVATLLMEDCAL